ncbi:unnamed protein product, partial [Durusdinium trenchii]
MNIERRKLFSPVVAKVKEAAEQAEDFLFGGTRSWCSGLKNPVVNRQPQWLEVFPPPRAQLDFSQL